MIAGKKCLHFPNSKNLVSNRIYNMPVLGWQIRCQPASWYTGAKSSLITSTILASKHVNHLPTATFARSDLERQGVRKCLGIKGSVSFRSWLMSSNHQQIQSIYIKREQFSKQAIRGACGNSTACSSTRTSNTTQSSFDISWCCMLRQNWSMP